MQDVKIALKSILVTLEQVLSNTPSQTRLDDISSLFKKLTDIDLDDLGDLSTQVLTINGTTYWDFDFSNPDMKILIQIKTGVQESYQILFDLDDE